MAVIHHPELQAESEVPDETLDIWCEIGWRPGTLDNPEPWEPPVTVDDLDDDDDLLADLGDPAEPTVPVGDTDYLTPFKED
jgi:hypothetical protein